MAGEGVHDLDVGAERVGLAEDFDFGFAVANFPS